MPTSGASREAADASRHNGELSWPERPTFRHFTSSLCSFSVERMGLSRLEDLSEETSLSR